MNDESEDIRIEETRGASVVTLGGKILDPFYIEWLSERLQDLASSQPSPKIVLDFSEVSHLSSSALGMLTTLHQATAAADGKLVLCSIQPAIAEIFKITRLDEVLTIEPDLDQAIRVVG